MPKRMTTSTKAFAALTITLANAAILLTLGGMVGLKAQGTAAQGYASPIAGPSTTRGTSLTTLGVGDRLRISFFEMVDIPGSGPSARSEQVPESLLRTFYQRMDLSAEHTIDQDGMISIPRLGAHNIAGRSPIELQTDLAAAFFRATGRQADVNIAIVERRPIYVVGPVKNAGAVKYVPEMTVLHAIALAGGMERDVANAGQLIESVREMERANKLTDRLKRLIARSARLEAERDDSSTLPAPAQLVALAGHKTAQTLLAGEQVHLQLAKIKRQQQESDAVKLIAAARKEVAALRAKLVPLEQQRRIRADYLQDVQKLKSSGFTTNRTIVIAQSEIADIEARRHDLNAALASAEARLTQAEVNRSLISFEHATGLVNAMTATEVEIADVSMSLESADRLASILEQRVSRSVLTQSVVQPKYEVLRQTRSGQNILAAEETTQLLPGDVLKIVLDTSWNLRTQTPQRERVVDQTLEFPAR